MTESGAGVASAAAARALVEALAAAGVTDACITPGSRSTPLTAAFARHGGVQPWLHLDERSSAFFALGLARESGQPVALVCTSGTAAANYLPAVVEANLSRVPLIVLTADRPPRLRDIGAEQTVSQVGIFGANTRWALDVQVPTGREDEPRHLRAVALRAVQTALAPLPGPVHLNLPYEEPLIDVGSASDGRSTTAAAAGVAVVRAPRVAPDQSALDAAARLLAGAERPLIIAGPETGGLPADAIARLARAMHAPILADPLSGLRCGPNDRSHVADAYDAVLRDSRANGAAPDAVIRFGGVPTSKALNLFLARMEAPTVLVDAHLSWRDPSATATAVIVGDAGLVADDLAGRLEPPAAAAGWLDDWLARDRRARAVLAHAACGFNEPFEGRVITELQRALPDGSRVLVGNSMPVRDLDAFLAASGQNIAFVGNRGANGIDGVVSSALGMAASQGGPAYLLIGDLSFYHDLNGLWAAKRHGLALTVVLVNNDGGGIFHYLPQADYPEVFEEWFGTPSGLDFALAVQMYGGTHTVASGWEAFAAAMAEPCRGLRVIEVRTDRVRNADMHRKAWAAAGEAAWGESGAAT